MHFLTLPLDLHTGQLYFQNQGKAELNLPYFHTRITSCLVFLQNVRGEWGDNQHVIMDTLYQHIRLSGYKKVQ